MSIPISLDTEGRVSRATRAGSDHLGSALRGCLRLDIEPSRRRASHAHSWAARQHARSLSDTPSGLIGAFVASRGPSTDGPRLHIYVEDIDHVLEEIEARGCEILEPVHTEQGVRVAQFQNPGGNVIGIWERAT